MLIKLKQVIRTLFISFGAHQAKASSSHIIYFSAVFIKLKQVLRTALIFRGAHQAKASSSQAHQATQVLHTLYIFSGVHQAAQVFDYSLTSSRFLAEHYILA